jgi:hypothetical protein
MPVEPFHVALILGFSYLKIVAVIHSNHFVKEFIPKDENILVRKASG